MGKILLYAPRSVHFVHAIENVTSGLCEYTKIVLFDDSGSEILILKPSWLYKHAELGFPKELPVSFWDFQSFLLLSILFEFWFFSVFLCLNEILFEKLGAV